MSIDIDDETIIVWRNWMNSYFQKNALDRPKPNFLPMAVPLLYPMQRKLRKCSHTLVDIA